MPLAQLADILDHKTWNILFIMIILFCTTMTFIAMVVNKLKMIVQVIAMIPQILFAVAFLKPESYLGMCICPLSLFCLTEAIYCTGWLIHMAIKSFK